MNGYTLVKIDNDTLLDMLVERVKVWIKDDDTIELFSQMYENLIDGGVFHEAELDIQSIVDNDCVNWCSVINKDEVDESEWARLKALYENGERDISCENFADIHGSFVEAMSDEQALVRA